MLPVLGSAFSLLAACSISSNASATDGSAESTLPHISAAEFLHLVEPHRMAERDEHPIVRNVVVLQIAAGRDGAAEPARQYDGKFAEGVAIAFAHLRAP